MQNLVNSQKHACVSTEVIIVGAGPIGLELAVSLQDAGVDYVHLERGCIGQTIADYPLQTRFFSTASRIAIAGMPLQTPDQGKATRETYLAYLRSVVDRYGLQIQDREEVVDLACVDDHDFQVTTLRRGETCNYSAKYVVLAIGDMHRPRLLKIPGEDLPHVNHYFKEPHQYFQQDLLIIGGKNSAVEAALRCYHAGSRVSISYRRDAFDPKSIKYWLLPEIESLIKHNEIMFYPSTEPTKITPHEVELKDASGRHRLVNADSVLAMTGYEQDKTLFEKVGLRLVGENQAPHYDFETMTTSIPGLYVAGTAAAGTQDHFKLFIENCHPHVTKIITQITGEPPRDALVNRTAAQFGLPES